MKMITKREDYLVECQALLMEYRRGLRRTGELIDYISDILTEVYNMKENEEDLD